MSALRCERVDATLEKEEGDMGDSVFGGRGMWMSRDEIRGSVVFGLRPCGLMRSMDCEVGVLELTQPLVCPVTLSKTVYVCLVYVCASGFSKVARTTSDEPSTASALGPQR